MSSHRQVNLRARPAARISDIWQVGRQLESECMTTKNWLLFIGPLLGIIVTATIGGEQLRIGKTHDHSLKICQSVSVLAD